MEQKNIMITGANAGIGKAAADALAYQGHRIIMVCRNPEKAENAKQDIIQKTGNKDIEIIIADHSSMSQVKSTAEEFYNQFNKLDVLINNAGLVTAGRNVTEDGFEEMFAVNHLSYFLLTNLLIDVLKKSNDPRIINVASGAHGRISRIDWNDLQSTRSFKPFIVYSYTKLLNILFTNELARRLKNTNIKANSMHPGFVASNFGKSGNAAIRNMVRMGRPFARSTKKGAETIVYLAVSPQVEDETGKYFFDKEPVQPSRLARDPDSAKKLWEKSENLLQSFLEVNPELNR